MNQKALVIEARGKFTTIRFECKGLLAELKSDAPAYGFANHLIAIIDRSASRYPQFTDKKNPPCEPHQLTNLLHRFVYDSELHDGSLNLSPYNFDMFPHPPARRDKSTFGPYVESLAKHWFICIKHLDPDFKITRKFKKLQKADIINRILRSNISSRDVQSRRSSSSRSSVSSHTTVASTKDPFKSTEAVALAEALLRAFKKPDTFNFDHYIFNVFEKIHSIFDPKKYLLPTSVQFPDAPLLSQIFSRHPSAVRRRLEQALGR